MRTSSSRMRSALISVMEAAFCASAFQVSFSISNSSTVAKRMARSIRRRSSENRCVGSPMARITFALRSVRPSTKSISSFFAGQIDIVGAEGSNFELQSVFQDNDNAEMRADRIRACKNFLHLLRARIGGDVNIFRREPADHVPNATAGEVGDVAVVVEFCRYGARSFLHSRRIVHPKGRAVH